MSSPREPQKMLPDPTLAFTIPSLHDGLPLDCRIYHPANASPRRSRRDAAILAHPYAPLGGSFDDPLLDLLGAQLLHRGFILGMFNFRGAGDSAGRTSWTARPERDDYASFVGFLVYYMHHLHLDDEVAETDDNAGSRPLPSSPVLLLGGYSYGAMVTTLLPPMDDLLERFTSPAAGSHAAQIRLKAASIAEQQTALSKPPESHQEHHADAHPPQDNPPPPTPAYLLISPLRSLTLFTVTLFLSSFFSHETQQEHSAEAKLVQNKTLALYGDDDMFVPVGKLRSWVEGLASRQGSRFQYQEIDSAGHFWSQEGVLDRMMDAVDRFAAELLGGETLPHPECG